MSINKPSVHRILSLVLLSALILLGVTRTHAADPGLLDRWHGHWVGESERFQPGVDVVTFHTEIIVEPIEDVADALAWTLVYSEGDTKQVRRYRLVVRDADNGAYAIDENNSIVLSMTMLGDSLHGMFEMKGARIVFFYRLHKNERPSEDALEMELVFFTDDVWEMTGGKSGAPEIRSGAAGSVQRVMLSRSSDDPGKDDPVKDAKNDEGDPGSR